MTIKIRIIQEVKNKDGKEQGVDGKACWKGKKYAGSIDTDGDGTPDKDKCIPMEESCIFIEDATFDDGTIVEDLGFWDDDLQEAYYRGKKVTLNKPTRGDVKKFKVYVNSGKKDSKGRIKAKKVNFGDKKMRIKKSNPKRRKSFRARHNCDNPGPKTKARYWSCKKW